MSPATTDPPPTGVKRTRGRTGCLNCRARRKKCDETKPTCSRCRACNESCHWDEVFPFRSMGVGLQRHVTPQTQGNNELQIVDVNFNQTTKRRKVQQSRVGEDSRRRQDLSTTSINDSGGNVRRDYQNSLSTTNELQRASPRLSSNDYRGQPPSNGMTPARDGQQSHASASVGESADAVNSSQLVSTEGHQFDGVDLGALDYLTSYVSNIDMLASAVQMGDVATWSPETDLSMLNAGEGVNASSPDMYSIYYPNAQYRELHSTLHQHMVETARNTALNRQGSPEPLVPDRMAEVSPTASFVGHGSGGAQTQNSYLSCELISPRRQLELWRNYLDEIAPWLDMLDNDRHFQTTVPLMAKSAAHLHYSILALSARQMERRSVERSYTESLALYQHAIQMIVHRLQQLETEVIASCVLLCVLEMMSSSPRAWARHLDGCAMLLEAAEINGAVGGVRQAVFWCFARMDLWGGYLGDTITKIPTNRWFIPSGSMALAVSQFKAGSNSDTYANYAVFLCASVVNVISTQEVSQASKRSRAVEQPGLYGTRWKALYDLLEDWHTDRPEELLPLMNEQTASTDYDNPFPIVLYPTSPGVSGNQMYHAAALLMLQHKPKDIRLPKTRKSILWHARQICGIAASNADHSAWTNALQPLWMAGKVMSHPSEHQAILSLLNRIERETGFATEWRANDLKEYWGDASE